MIKKNSQVIIPGSTFGNPREQAKNNPYSESSIEQRTRPPKLYSPNIVSTASGMRRTANTTGGNALWGGATGASQSMAQSPLYYDYRWSTPDKFYFPRNRVVANSIWREIYKRDPTVAAATDMYAELPWSDFDITGIDDSEIRKIYEDMFNTLNLVPRMQSFTRDYLITGELILHTIFDSARGIWSRVIPHDPDYVRVEGIGLVMDQPLMWLRPTPEIRKLINSPDPRIRKLQQLLPREMLNSFRMGIEVPLDPLNTTYMCRLNRSNEVRGTSIYTRLYRVVMYEDFVTNASLAIAQRNAAPLRIFKLGNRENGWLASEEDEAALAEMLSIAESDPLAAIIMHHDLTVDLVGVSDRVLLISKEWDFIERVKLLALGISKSFLTGESSLASSVVGLQTLLERLSAMRNKFEKEWIVKKLCEPIAKMHDFYKVTQSELDNRIRIKRTEDKQLLVPKIKWHKGLEPAQDASILTVWRDLKDRGVLSDRTYSTGAGVDIEVERNNLDEEAEYAAKKGKSNSATTQGPGNAPVPPSEPKTPPPLASIELATHKNIDKRGFINTRIDDDIEDAIYNVANRKNGMVNVQDAIEAVKEVMDEKRLEEERLGLAEKQLNACLPQSGKSLLSGI